MRHCKSNGWVVKQNDRWLGVHVIPAPKWWTDDAWGRSRCHSISLLDFNLHLRSVPSRYSTCFFLCCSVEPLVNLRSVRVRHRQIVALSLTERRFRWCTVTNPISNFCNGLSLTYNVRCDWERQVSLDMVAWSVDWMDLGDTSNFFSISIISSSLSDGPRPGMLSRGQER